MTISHPRLHSGRNVRNVGGGLGYSNNEQTKGAKRIPFLGHTEKEGRNSCSISIKIRSLFQIGIRNICRTFLSPFCATGASVCVMNTSHQRHLRHPLLSHPLPSPFNLILSHLLCVLLPPAPQSDKWSTRRLEQSNWINNKVFQSHCWSPAQQNLSWMGCPSSFDYFMLIVQNGYYTS